MKYNLIATLLVTVLGVHALSQTASAQAIFNASPSAVPGEAIGLQGDFGNPVTAYMSVGTSTTPIAMPVRVQGYGQATVEVPTNVNLDLYKVWVQNPGQTTAGPAVYVNRAWGMHFDSPEVTPGGEFRIFGRNLKLNGASPEVYLVEQNTTNRLQASVNSSQSDAYILSVTAPAGGTNGLQPNTTYDVYVRNGFGGSTGETKVEQPLRTIAKGVDVVQPSNEWEDHFNLGIEWANKFNFYGRVYNVRGDSKLTTFAQGDGVADDRAAIQAAIIKANADGGGIVYLPSGTYKILVSGVAGIEMRDNVVLMGDGKANTHIKYGYGTTGFKYGLTFPSGECMGVSDLSIENVNENGHWRYNMNAYPGPLSDIFLNNVKFTYSGEAISFIKDGVNGNVTQRVLIKGCELTSRFNRNLDQLDGNGNIKLDNDDIPINDSQGPMTFINATDVILKGNTIKHEVGQSGFNGWGRNVILEDNTFIRDAAIGQGSNPVIMDTRTVSLNFVTNVAILNSHFETINGAAYDKTDGETILSEGGGPDRRDSYYGAVSSATSNTITTNGNSWGNLGHDAIIVILSGTGAGQSRRITARYVDTLHVDRNWDVTPDSTSRYSITNWSAANWLIRGNTALNNRAGIELYAASGNNLAVVDNHLTNNDGILLRTAHSVMGSAKVLNPISNVQILNNTVTHTAASLYQQIPAYIGVLTLQTEANTLGVHTRGVEIKGNTVTGLTGYTPLPTYGSQHHPNNNRLNADGFYNYLITEFFDPAYPDEPRYFGNNGDTPIMVGTIFQNNTAVNCSSAYHLNSGAYNTLICSPTLVNTSNLVSDTYAGNAPIISGRHTSVNTVICPDDNSLRNPENPANTFAGLNYGYYEGSWSTLPDFGSLTPISSGGTNDINLGPSQRNWAYGLQFTGYITVPTDGTYTFYTSSDDGSKLYIGSTEVVDNDGGHATQERSGTIGLKAGTHAFKVVYFQSGGAMTLDVSYQGPSISKQAIPTSAYRR